MLRRERPTFEALVVEEFVMPVPTLLGYVVEPERNLGRGFGASAAPAHKARLDNDKHALLPVELRVLVDLLAENEQLEEICFTGARVRENLSWISQTISPGRMPLVKLLLADNGISVQQGISLIKALRAGAGQLQVLDLSLNPICGVEEALDGGHDEFDSACIEALAEWVTGACQLQELHLVDVALCGRAKDGNGTYQPSAVGLMIDALGSDKCWLRDLDMTGSGMLEEEAFALGRGLVRNNGSLRVLKVDKLVLEPPNLLRGESLDVDGEIFSELDAVLMVQLLLHNTTLTRMDLSGTRPLPREIKILSDALGRCKFPLRELCVNGRGLGLESCASLLEPLRGGVLETLELRKNEICGVRANGREVRATSHPPHTARPQLSSPTAHPFAACFPLQLASPLPSCAAALSLYPLTLPLSPPRTQPFSTYVLKIVVELIVRPGGGLRKLNVQENNLLGNDAYSSEASSARSPMISHNLRLISHDLRMISHDRPPICQVLERGRHAACRGAQVAALPSRGAPPRPRQPAARNA